MREPLASFSHWRYHDEVELGRDAIESIELLQTAVQVGASGPASATVPFAAGRPSTRRPSVGMFSERRAVAV